MLHLSCIEFASKLHLITNDFRDILIEPFETIKEEDQVDMDLGESSKCMYFDYLAPINLRFCTGQS